ncbi:MAG: hypothetical protein IIC61_09500 [Proteobacteria bacterium]|nr:hypothetical protein [Pseudomonadota bacterium]
MLIKRTNIPGIRQAGLLAGCLASVIAFGDDVTGSHDIIPTAIANNAVLLRECALLDNLSVDIVESLTTEVGPRRVGTDGDQRVIAWALTTIVMHTPAVIMAM